MKTKLLSIVGFIKLESSAAIILPIMALFVLIATNSGLSEMQYGFLDTNIRIGIGTFEISKVAVFLMIIFFFLVGLEIKGEVLVGELSNWKQASLPIFAAIGGMAFPALVYTMTVCRFISTRFSTNDELCAIGCLLVLFFLEYQGIQSSEQFH